MREGLAMTYNEWLDGLPFYIITDVTGKGAVLDLVICVYESGLTALTYQKPGAAVKTEQLLANQSEAMQAYQDIRARAQQYAQHNTLK